MRTFYLVTMIILMLIPSIGIANVCVVKGDPAKWVENYCLIKHKMANTESSVIKECVKTEDKKVVIAGCEGNIVIKERICELLIKRNQYSGQINDCIKEEIDINELIKMTYNKSLELTPISNVALRGLYFGGAIQLKR